MGKPNKVWVCRGIITDPEIHNFEAKRGDPEWQFSDGPPGLRSCSSDYADLEKGLRDHRGYEILWVK